MQSKCINIMQNILFVFVNNAFIKRQPACVCTRTCMHYALQRESVFLHICSQSWLGISQPELLCSSSCVSCVHKAVPLHNVCVFDISEHCCLLPREVSSLWCLWGFVVEGRPMTLRFTCTPLFWRLLQHNEESSSLKLALHACPVRETQPSRTQWGDLAECLQSDRIVHYTACDACAETMESQAAWIRFT